MGDSLLLSKKQFIDKRNEFSQYKSITDLICSWNVEDILDADFFKDKVETIPKSFSSADEYLGAHIYPLIEETRAELCSAFEILSKVPFSEVTSLKLISTEDKLLYDVEVNYWRNNSSGRMPFPVRQGDMFILTDAKPENGFDLQRLKMKWNIVSVIDTAKNETEDYKSSFSLRLKSLRKIKFQDYGKSFLIFLLNITINNRIWKALNMHTTPNILLEVMDDHHKVKKNCCLCSEVESMISEKFTKKLSAKLNDSQVSTLFGCLKNIQCIHELSVDLISGPPGSGKTKITSILLYCLLGMKSRVVACSSTFLSVANLANHLLKLINKLSRGDCQGDDFIYPLGDIILFGIDEHLTLDLENINLDRRVESLLECFDQQFGWNRSFSSMIQFLEDFENVALPSDDSFESKASPLRQSIYILFTHISKSFILERNFQAAVLILNLINYFKTLLSLGGSSANLTLLHGVRVELLSSLKPLYQSLGILGLPFHGDKDSIVRFCLERASIIFCTATSSARLLKMKMVPIDLLIVDDATQMKESETMIPLQLPYIRHVILIGDECQLSAVVNSNVSNKAGFGRSQFERLSSLGQPKNTFHIQYRMNPSINAFPNSIFYSNQILDAENVKVGNYTKHFLSGPMFGPYAFINVDGREEADDVHGYMNLVEVAVVITILKKLYIAWQNTLNSFLSQLSIGVVSPYTRQVSEINERVKCKFANSGSFIVKARSFDELQGAQDDITIISMVRSNNFHKVGLISSSQRINVALTRARYCLWIVGNENALTCSASLWSNLISDSKSRECYFNAFEDKDLQKSIIAVKEELNQLDDLFNKGSTFFLNARWQVLFSDDFRQSFGRLKPRSKKMVITFLLRLSIGWRPKRIQKFDCGNYSKMFKPFKVENVYILCSNDIVKRTTFTQVLKAWDILALFDVSRLTKRLCSMFEMYTDDYLGRCNYKFLQGKLELPMIWVASTEIVKYKVPGNSKFGTDSLNSDKNFEGSESSKVNESLLLMKFYSLSSDAVKCLLSNYDGNKFELPFEMSEQEIEIIQFDKSSFILGRSGTGKTTVLTMKLFQKEQLFYVAIDRFNANGIDSFNDAYLSKGVSDSQQSRESKEAVFRQIFVTVSSKLCIAVRKHISGLMRFASGGEFLSHSSDDTGGLNDPEDFSNIPDSFIDLQPKSYPLVITFRKFLIMLDGTVGKSFFDRFPNKRNFLDGRSGRTKSLSLFAFISTNEVNYEKFCTCYWPRFDTRLTKDLDPLIVFTEILSHIKGGLEALKANNGRLSEDEYVLSERRVSFLGEEKRKKVYEIFKTYEKKKNMNWEFDASDIANDLHSRLRYEIYSGDLMDFVYIDEVQDLSMGQIALFRYICRNFSGGYMFCGDTAQAIAKGVSFRFEDLRHLFFKEFVSEFTGVKTNWRSEKGKISDLFHLSNNFRTHVGVINLAQSVIDLLCHFFPFSIDSLPPESSFLNGELPVLFLSGNHENTTIIKAFGCSELIDNSIVGFGAEQVILVRDDFNKKHVSEIVGDKALVLTILESKGLEFQDVLLYNFFDSSSLEKEWKAIYQFMTELKFLDFKTDGHSFSFDELKHNTLCSELKQLYVAITRTRQRLWICDCRNENYRSMFDYWEALSLVQFKQLDDSLIRQMQVASSKDEWRSRGIQLFQDHNYDAAIFCFERAGDISMKQLSKANALLSKSKVLWNTNSDDAKEALLMAAETFDAIGKSEVAASCFYELNDYKRAGRIYEQKCGESMCDKAAECFFKAGEFRHAAKLYSTGGFFSECLNVCNISRLFDTGLQFIQCWRKNHQTDSRVANEIQFFLESAALYYYKSRDISAMMKFVKAFCTIDSRRVFLEKEGCLVELLKLEEESENFLEAAKVAKKLGDLMTEARQLEKAGHFKDASLINLWFLLSESPFIRTKESHLDASKQCKVAEKAKKLSKIHSDDGLYDFVCSVLNILLCPEIKEESCITGLKLIKIWKKNTGSQSYVDKTWEVYKIEQNLLEECALHYLSKNKKSMMSYVNSFHTLDEKRDFLKRHDCLDELLQMEIDLGEFEKAAMVAKRKDDLLHEADLKEKAGYQSDSSLIILWYLFRNCFGTLLQNKYPTLEKSKIKELCGKAKELAKVHSQSFYEFVSHEADILCITNTIDELYEKGLQFVQCWIDDHFSNDYAFKSGYRIHDIKQDWLERCARHCFDQKDKEQMMKYVKTFCSDSKKRSFLKELNCLDERIQLEIYLGEFDKAVKIATQKGDLVYEAELVLLYFQDFKQSSMLLLLHVYSNSLWISGNRNWPIKSFEQKEELLQRAISYAKKVSTEFTEMVCTEAAMLSNPLQTLLELVKYLNASRNHGSLKGKMMCSRKILDSLISLNPSLYIWVDHFLVESEITLPQYLTSVEALHYFWNLWKDTFLKISCLSQNLDSEFCLNFLGLRIHYHGVNVYSDSDWVRNFSKKSLNGMWFTSNRNAFVSCALDFCESEIFSVGLQVLRTLKKLYNLSVEKPLSLFCQSTPLIHIFEVTTFLKQFNKPQQSWMLQEFSNLAIQHFFTNVFPVEWLKSLDMKMIHTRLSEHSKNMLEDILKQKGDLVSESNLLCVYGDFQQASMLLLLHVYSKSLWIFDDRNWPIKPFVEKAELLHRTVSYAKEVSTELSDLVSIEASILSNASQNLIEMLNDLNACWKHRSLNGELMCSRKILDFYHSLNPSFYIWAVHPLSDAELMLPENLTSLETLVYFWNLWKDTFHKISCFLSAKLDSEFCLCFLGVRIQSDGVLIYSDADWVRRISKRRFNGVWFTPNREVFVSAALNFCQSEILSVGLEVLNTLKTLYNLSVMNSLTLFCQSMPLIHIFEVARFLLQNTSLVNNSSQSWILQDFCNFAIHHFFTNVFPVDWLKSLDMQMIHLRCSERSKNLLEDFISTNIYSDSSEVGPVTGGLFERVMITLLGSDLYSAELFLRISRRFQKIQPWFALSEVLVEIRSASPNSSSTESLKSLAHKYNVALHDIHHWKWKFDCISPMSFLYLMERLMILVSLSEKYFYTSESSFVEWVIHHELPQKPSISAAVNNIPSPADNTPTIRETLNSLSIMVHSFLYDKPHTMEWIKNSDIDLNIYPMLVLRLVVIACLLCLTSKEHRAFLYDVLSNDDITSQLPRAFFDTLQKLDRETEDDLNVFAEAFKTIGNRLVIVGSVENLRVPLIPNFVFVDVAKNSREGILGILFPASS